jgi:hypothetical protein
MVGRQLNFPHKSCCAGCLPHKAPLPHVDMQPRTASPLSAHRRNIPGSITEPCLIHVSYKRKRPLAIFLPAARISLSCNVHFLLGICTKYIKLTHTGRSVALSACFISETTETTVTFLDSATVKRTWPVRYGSAGPDGRRAQLFGQ